MGKKHLKCLLCNIELHKSEAEFITENTFSLLNSPPQETPIGSYCLNCFDMKIRAFVDSYIEKVERAKNVNVFYISQNKESGFVRRSEKPIKVDNCADRDEVVMKLALLAVEAGKNTIVDVDFTQEQIRNGGWQTSSWGGKGIPANVFEKALKNRSL